MMSYTTLGLLLLATLKSIFDEICKQETAHYTLRHKIFMEYAYQHLFQRISKKWERANNKGNRIKGIENNRLDNKDNVHKRQL